MSHIIAFASQDEFEGAAKAFMEKYGVTPVGNEAKIIGPERTNTGWEWIESRHKVSWT